MDEAVIGVPDWPEAAGTYESFGDSGRYRVELTSDGTFRFFVCSEGSRECTVWGRWVTGDGSLGGIGLRLMPHVPGVSVWSKWTLWLRATPDSRPTELWFDWLHFDPTWSSFQPGRSMRFVRVAG